MPWHTSFKESLVGLSNPGGGHEQSRTDRGCRPSRHFGARSIAEDARARTGDELASADDERPNVSAADDPARPESRAVSHGARTPRGSAHFSRGEEGRPADRHSRAQSRTARNPARPADHARSPGPARRTADDACSLSSLLSERLDSGVIRSRPLPVGPAGKNLLGSSQRAGRGQRPGDRSSTATRFGALSPGRSSLSSGTSRRGWSG
jgi:hypothetical protein